MNRYVYCRNNPIKYIDPSGKLATELAIATAPEWVPYVIAGIVAVGSIFLAAEHHKKGTTNPANKAKHEAGQSRKQRDAGGEKGDSRRIPRKDKKK